MINLNEWVVAGVKAPFYEQQKFWQINQDAGQTMMETFFREAMKGKITLSRWKIMWPILYNSGNLFGNLNEHLKTFWGKTYHKLGEKLSTF